MGEYAAAGCRLDQGFSGGCSVPVGPAGQRDARPFDAQHTGVGGAVGRVVQYGEDVMEQVFDAGVDTSEVTVCSLGEIRTLSSVTVTSYAVVSEPCREKYDIPLPKLSPI